MRVLIIILLYCCWQAEPINSARGHPGKSLVKWFPRTGVSRGHGGRGIPFRINLSPRQLLFLNRSSGPFRPLYKASPVWSQRRIGPMTGLKRPRTEPPAETFAVQYNSDVTNGSPSYGSGVDHATAQAAFGSLSTDTNGATMPETATERCAADKGKLAAERAKECSGEKAAECRTAKEEQIKKLEEKTKNCKA